MDEFVSFDFVLLDASAGPSRQVRIVDRGVRRERIDLIARQFHDFLRRGDQSDTAPHGMVLTHDFKLRRQVGRRAGWLTFLVDRGSGKPKVAAFVDQTGHPIVCLEGADCDGRYHIWRVGAESVDISYLDGTGRRTIRLGGG